MHNSIKVPVKVAEGLVVPFEFKKIDARRVVVKPKGKDAKIMVVREHEGMWVGHPRGKPAEIIVKAKTPNKVFEALVLNFWYKKPVPNTWFPTSSTYIPDYALSVKGKVYSKFGFSSSTDIVCSESEH